MTAQANRRGEGSRPRGRNGDVGRVVRPRLARRSPTMGLIGWSHHPSTMLTFNRERTAIEDTKCNDYCKFYQFSGLSSNRTQSGRNPIGQHCVSG